MEDIILGLGIASFAAVPIVCAICVLLAILRTPLTYFIMVLILLSVLDSPGWTAAVLVAVMLGLLISYNIRKR